MRSFLLVTSTQALENALGAFLISVIQPKPPVVQGVPRSHKLYKWEGESESERESEIEGKWNGCKLYKWRFADTMGSSSRSHLACSLVKEIHARSIRGK